MHILAGIFVTVVAIAAVIFAVILILEPIFKLIEWLRK